MLSHENWHGDSLDSTFSFAGSVVYQYLWHFPKRYLLPLQYFVGTNKWHCVNLWFSNCRGKKIHCSKSTKDLCILLQKRTQNHDDAIKGCNIDRPLVLKITLTLKNLITNVKLSILIPCGQTKQVSKEFKISKSKVGRNTILYKKLNFIEGYKK